MARFYWNSPEDTQDTYKVASLWKDACLVKKTALLWDGESIWNRDNLKELKYLFVDKEDLSDKNFWTKLRNQLQSASSDCIKLTCDILAVYFLFPKTESISATTKIKKIQEVADYKGLKIDTNTIAYKALNTSLGIGNAGTAYNTLRYLEIAFLINFALYLLDLPEVDCQAILDDHSKLQNLLDNLQGKNKRPMRNIILHLFYPDVYERITSTESKEKIYKTFSERIGLQIDPSSNVDDGIYQIRKFYEQQHPGESLDFYRSPLLEIWNHEDRLNGSLKSNFDDILAIYIDTKNITQFNKRNKIWQTFDILAQKLTQTEVVKKHFQIEIKWSVGMGNWAKVPWIAFLDKRETLTTQKGIYVVILFRQNMTGYYLTLNQGVADPKKSYGAVQGKAQLIDTAQRIREQVAELVRSDFQLDNKIDLMAEAGLGADYQTSTIAYKFYGENETPEDFVFLNDLDLMLNVYTSVIDKQKSASNEQTMYELQKCDNVNSLQIKEINQEFDEKINYAEPNWDEIWHSIYLKGMRISKDQLRRYHLSLKIRNFVILCGVSGTGKTWLAESYAAAVGAQHKLVPVSPNWTTNEDLLGFFNPLVGEAGKYNYTDFSLFLIEAAEEWNKSQIEKRNPRPYHLILDEMNLARVEHYFAKFLSAMEVRVRTGKGIIVLYKDKQVDLTPNLFFIGTVNVDETTHGFAEKVYDRAQIIELNINRSELIEYIGDQPYREVLIQIWDKISNVAPFAYRTVSEIKQYVAYSMDLGLSWKEAFDDQLLQKILPKVKGLDPKVQLALEEIIEISSEQFPKSHEKALNMLKGYKNYGFVSYF